MSRNISVLSLVGLGTVLAAFLIFTNLPPPKRAEAVPPPESLMRMEPITNPNAYPTSKPKPKPKPEPEPKRTAEQLRRDAIRAYMINLQDWADRLHDFNDNLSERALSAGEDISVIDDPAWMGDIRGSLSSVQDLADEITGVKPPRECRKVHRLLESTVKEQKRAYELFYAGAYDRSVTELKDAAAAIHSSNTEAVKAAAEVLNVLAKYGAH